jgi:hypothetical protein
VAADAILGIPYAAEELDDGNTTAPEQPKRTAQRRTVRAKASVERPTAPEPELPEAAPDPELPDDEPAAEPEPTTIAERMVTRAQLDKLHATLTELEVKDRAEKLQTVGMLAGRELGSSSEMTLAEASKVIDILDKCLQADEPARALDFALANVDEQGGDQ